MTAAQIILQIQGIVETVSWETAEKLLLFPHRNHPESDAWGWGVVTFFAVDADVVARVKEAATGDSRAGFLQREGVVVLLVIIL